MSRTAVHLSHREVVLVALGLLAFSFAAAQQPPSAPPRPPAIVRPGIKTPGVVKPIASLAPQTVFPVQGTPDWSVITKDAVWVSSARVNHVVQLFPGTGKPGLVVDVARPCSGLAYGFGSIWVPGCKDHSLERLDETTGKTTAQILADPATSEGGITVGAGSVWMVIKPATLIRIDPATNTIASRLDLPSESANPVFGDGFVWVSSFAHNQLLKIDPKSNAIVATIPVGPQPRFLTVGAGSVWTLNQRDGTISRVDMATGKLIANIECGIPGEGGEIAYGAGSIWAAMFDFPLTQVDVATNKVVHQWSGKGGDGVRFGFGSVWLSNLLQGTVWRIKPE
jgi:virginiamycin B lyase